MFNLKLYEGTIENFKNNLSEISENLEYFLDKTLIVGNDFGGPSIYFHKKALLEQKNNFLSDEHLNMIYAVMPSWGMHRMGSKGAKMVNFDIFKKEIMKNITEINELKNRDYQNINIDNIAKLITEKIHVSKSFSYLVSSSKVLHHIIPEIFCPIDRNYSLRFMKYNKNHWGSKAINVNNEYAYAYIFYTQMYNFLNINEKIMSEYIIEVNNENINDINFNTSLTKIFDNLIMAYVKEYMGELFE